MLQFNFWSKIKAVIKPKCIYDVNLCGANWNMINSCCVVIIKPLNTQKNGAGQGQESKQKTKLFKL